ncbi:hypothetical protein [Chryseobacterium nepalense]|uniref:Uncharacterized protein n=1 Tax=Chryseobacterium nepalense TaxID=1854498 RepID=A0ABY4K0X0_9FLAO|nr:hypothetical protein [Chryseobacterium nepalense]UPQ74450.1 hypothetical protein M0D58_10340 [Chryseobacterium nepalense]
MKMSENSIEYQVKKQISEREVAPSRDLWSEIQAHKPVESARTKINWFLVAACVVLTFSLGIVLFFNQDNHVTERYENIAKVGKTEVQLPAQNKLQKKSAKLIVKNTEQKIAAEKISADNQKVLKESPAVIHDELPLIQQNSPHVIAEITPVESAKIIAQSDSAKIHVKKKRYVDPSTLLFSVEHKDVIEKTKGKSNVASIDLNEK